MHTYSPPAERRSSDWLARATIAGFIAIGVAALTMVVVSGVAGSLGAVYRSNGLLFEWMYQLTNNDIVQLGGEDLWKALLVHAAFGMVWAFGYALLFEPRLRQYPGWQAGAIYSMLPYFLSVAIFLPLTGGGLFGSELNAGPLPLIGNLILHLVWGATLGAGYGAGFNVAEAPDDTEQEVVNERATMRRAESSAASGIIFGLLFGGVVGSVLGLVLPFASREGLVGSWPFAMGMAGALCGGALGALLGSMAGLSQPDYDEVAVAEPITGQPIAAALLPLGVILIVATLIVSLGSLLLTVAGPLHQEGHYYYGMPIVVGVAILILVIVVSAVLDRTWGDPTNERPQH